MPYFFHVGLFQGAYGYVTAGINTGYQIAAQDPACLLILFRDSWEFITFLPYNHFRFGEFKPKSKPYAR